MHRLLATAAVFALLVPAAGAQGTKKESTTKTKDSPAAAATRKRLDTKVTVDFKETGLLDVTKNLKEQVENLSIWLDNAGGVSNNIPITYKATDKSLKEVLDGMFQKTDLGYVIGQAKDKRYDGWLLIKKGKFRGDEVEAKTAAKSKEPEKTEPKPESKAERAEKDAASKLRVAKKLAADGLTEKAKQRYKEIVEKYPNTKAGKEAKQLLEK